MPIALPDWCELVRGEGRVLLVAPHGGRRPPVDPAAPPANLKVNDVHTAELTRALAPRLDASAVINHGCDRNALDLNRRSQVRRQAAWFFALLRDQIAAVLARHACAEILFIHGWNVGQAKCDIGIGARQIEHGLVTPDNAGLTVTPAYFDERIEPLRAAMERRDIATFIGIRYPASHPNNLLQVFTSRDPGDQATAEERELGAWAAAGRVQAVQLELGVPLRWPGAWRDRFFESIDETFAAKSSPGVAPTRASTRTRVVPPQAAERGAVSLQFYDPIADLGLLSGVGPTGKDTDAARLLLFLGGQRVALFTGEQTPAARLSVEPLHFEENGDELRLRFAGPLLHLDDGVTYLDLEAAFVASTLADVAVDLRFTRSGVDAAGSRFGHVEGWIDLGAGRRVIAAGAHVNAPSTRTRSGDGAVTLTAAFGSGHGLLLRAGRSSSAVEFRSGGTREVESSLISPPQQPSVGVALVDERELHITSQSRMEILRSLPGGEYIRVTFGTAQVRWEDREGHGIYEYASRAKA